MENWEKKQGVFDAEGKEQKKKRIEDEATPLRTCLSDLEYDVDENIK